MTVQERLRQIITQHCVWLEAKVDEIEGALASDGGDWTRNAEAIQDLRELVHQITGSSGTMGFPALSDAAGALERYLVRINEDVDRCPHEDRQRVADLFGRLKSVAAEVTPERSTLYHTDLAGVGRAL